MASRSASMRRKSRSEEAVKLQSDGAGPSRQSKPKTSSRKRAAESPEVEEEDDELELNGNVLDEEDDDGEEDEDEEDEANAGSDEEEPFPELDSGSESEGLDDDRVQGLGDLVDAEEEGDEEDSDYEVVDDEESGSESGYNSSDIEAMYSSSTSVSSHASSSKRAAPGAKQVNGTSSRRTRDDKMEAAAAELAARTDLTTDEKLARMIAADTVKPDENIGSDAAKISRAKDGKGKLRPSKLVEGGYLREYDDIEAGYGSESSTEDNPNTVGNIPMEWYDDLPHIGYNVSGRKIFRPARGDELDKFLANAEDPTAWTNVEDKSLGQNVQLTDKELDIIRRLERAENPDGDFDPYQDTIEWFTGKGRETVMPLSAAPEPKRRFVPSKWEHQKVMKIVKAIREGRIVPNKPSATKPPVYAIWSDTDVHNPHAMYMPAPQLPPPKTSESYNPPEEYLPTDKEKADFEALEKEDRPSDFLPQKYDSLRHVPGYKNLVQERFERCLDLYLAPRTRRVKLNIDPESLIPKLPSPRELRPFPTASCVQYRHPGDTRVRGISVSPGGEWVASGSEDGTVRVWDLGNGREVWKWNLKSGAIQHVEWSPNREELLLSALVEGKVVVVSPLALASPGVCERTLEHVNTAFASSSASTNTGGTEAIKWVRPNEGERERGVLVIVQVPGTPKQIAWHRRGDYFATVSTNAADKSVLIHQLSKHATQSPFRKTGGSVQRVAFHPSKPHFFTATQRHVRLYDLSAQKLIKTLQTGLKWISSMDVHPGGDNVIVGSYDKKLGWFDLDLSNKPFKTLRYHTRALRSVAFHPTLPLFASSSDDGTIHIFHATVYNDLSQNPLIVPLKILKGHKVTEGLGVLDVRWHPEKPWLVSSGADGEVRLWCS